MENIQDVSVIYLQRCWNMNEWLGCDSHRLKRWRAHTALFLRLRNATGVAGFLPHETHHKNKSRPREKYLNQNKITYFVESSYLCSPSTHDPVGCVERVMEYSDFTFASFLKVQHLFSLQSDLLLFEIGLFGGIWSINAKAADFSSVLWLKAQTLFTWRAPTILP